jgi:tubulin beta
MGTLLIQLGQCGNQIGLQTWEYLQNMHYYENDYLFRREQNIAHSIMIDTEAKVLKPISENRKKYSFIDSRNIIFQQNGRGNNWSLGYFDSRHLEENKGLFPKKQERYTTDKIKRNVPKTLIEDKYMKENTSILENISDSIRREIEKIDYYLGCMFIYSLGGGTGSGLGSRVLEEMRDEYDGNKNV